MSEMMQGPVVTMQDGRRAQMPPCRLVQLPGDLWRGECTIPTSRAPITLTATTSAANIRRLVSVEVRRRARGGAEVAGLLSSISHLAKKVVSKKTMRALASGYKAVASSPIVQGAVAASLQSMGVPPNVSVAALKASVVLVDAADGPDRQKAARAKTRIAQIHRAAQTGQPAAVKALATLKAAYAAKTATGSHPAAQVERALNPGRRPRGARIVTAQRAGAGRTLVVFEVGGPVMDWIKDNWGFHRGVRSDDQLFSARDAYRQGAAGYGARVKAHATVGAAPSRRARVVSTRRRPGGKHLVCFEVGGPVMDWIRQNWGYHRGIRDDRAQFSARDAYRQGAAGYGARTARQVQANRGGTNPDRIARR